MSQIFHRRTNTISRVSIGALVILVALVFSLLAEINASPYITHVNIVRDQPVPFSHQHHVGGLGIDCRYCHQFVERSATAGIPPASTCMNCHSQMWADAPMLEPVRRAYKTNAPLTWTKVHDFPDYAYFNHGIHVSKGIGCASCHGAVDKMPLMWKHASLQMRWCLDCHRNPEAHLRPKEEVFNMSWSPAPGEQAALGAKLARDYHVETRTDCYACHR